MVMPRKIIPLLVLLGLAYRPSPAQTPLGSLIINGAEQFSGRTADTGTVTATINGVSVYLRYGQFSTPASIASDLAALISQNCNMPVYAMATGNTLTFYQKGTNTIASETIVSASNNPSLFPGNSFAAADSSVAQEVACQPVYQQCVAAAYGVYGACLTSNDDIGYPPIAYCQEDLAGMTNACSSALGECSEMFVFPKAKLVSILYMPPGNKSTVGYSSTSSTGTTDTVTESFSSTTTQGLTFSLGGFSIGGTVSITNSSSTSTTDMTTIQNTESTTWSTSGDPIDHTQDVLTLWLNPQITVVNFDAPGFFRTASNPDGGTMIAYTLGNAAYNPSSSTNGSPVNADAIASGDMSNINVTVASLQNPTTLLPSELVSRTNSDGTLVPGLLSLCANRMPESQCTTVQAQANACGCTAADFAPFVQQDPFFNPSIPNPTIANINAADPNNARMVPVLNNQGNNLMPTLQYGESQTVMLTDQYNTSQTYSHTISKTEGISIGYNSKNPGSGGSTSSGGNNNPLSFDWTNSASATESYTESIGTSQGTSHTQSLFLETTNASCFDPVNVFEDTVFHTFVFTNGSNAPNPCP